MRFETKIEIESSKSKGSVLLFCLGVLALLSLLATALQYMTRRDALETRDYVDAMRAHFAAESGLETALANLMKYRGQLSDLPQYYSAEPVSGLTPLKYCMQSSFGQFDMDGDGFKELAGVISETYADKGDSFKLRVESSQSKLNINDSNAPWNVDTDPYEDQIDPDRNYLDIPTSLRYPSEPANPSLDQDPDWVYPGDPDYNMTLAIKPNKPYPKAPGRLEAMLKELLFLLFDSNELAEKTAKEILLRRNGKGGKFNSLSEIRDILVPKYLDPDQYKLFESQITLDSWSDSQVLLPTFQWRLNTPPPTDPLDLNSMHYKEFPGDYFNRSDWSPAWTNPPTAAPSGDWGPVTRPGYIPATLTKQGPIWKVVKAKPGPRGADMLNSVAYDFNHDGGIANDEIIGHSRDIYQYSDMQTKYFELDQRCPIDVNNAPLLLLEALIAPVQGWYLKEAPSIWEGEDPQSRAEDWSQFGKSFNSGHSFGLAGMAGGHPWLLAMRSTYDGFCILDFGLAGWSTSAMIPPQPDAAQYYYYDSYARNHRSDNNWNPAESPYYYALKNGRHGELNQSKSLMSQSIAEPGTRVAKLIARAIHGRIHPDLDGDNTPDSYHPFTTWEEFEDFLLDLADGDGQNDLDQRDFDIYAAHALIANFNPNSRINDYNPNKRFFLHVDKSQLISHTTELCFHPMGFFEISSFGSVRSDTGQYRSALALKAQSKCMEFFRVTTQSDFMSGYNPISCPSKNFFSESRGATKTFGANAAYAGDSLQSYPEPEVLTGNWIQQSVFDGYLSLATTQAEAGEYFGDAGIKSVFHAGFCRSLDATTSNGNPAMTAHEGDEVWSTPTEGYRWSVQTAWIVYDCKMDPHAKLLANRPTASPLTLPRSGRKHAHEANSAPGVLFPDGALSDAGRTLGYESLGNIGDAALDGRVGSLQFWFKPNYDAAHSNRVRKLFSNPARPFVHPDRIVFVVHSAYHPDVYDQYKDYLTFMPNCGLGTSAWMDHWKYNHTQEFGLYYFSRGGKNVAKNFGNFDELYPGMGYDPDTSKNDGHWLPTRSMFLGMGEYGWRTGNQSYGYKYIHGIGSDTLNQSWRTSEEEASPDLVLQQVESRQWNCVSLSWDWVGKSAEPGDDYNNSGTMPPDQFAHLCINGKSVSEFNKEMPAAKVTPDSEWQQNFATQTYPFRHGIQSKGGGGANYLRFGESSSNPWNNHVADATFDDIVSSSSQHGEYELGLEFSYARYNVEEDSVYTSPSFDIFKKLGSDAKSMELHSVAWTLYWPWSANSNANPNHPRWNDNLDAGSGAFYINTLGALKKDGTYPADPMDKTWGGNFAPVSFDILNPKTGKWLYEDLGITPYFMPNYAGGSRDVLWNDNPIYFDSAQSGNLRFKIHFMLDDSQTLFVTPVLDDITFAFIRNQPKILRMETQAD